jgi:hypothetical protein
MSQIDDAPRARLALDLAPGTSVAIVHWPEERELAHEMSASGHAVLLLVAPDADPPVAWDRLTDWLRMPADDGDVFARVETLQRRLDRPPAPFIDEFDVVWRGAQWVALSPVEARIFTLLLDRECSVVSRRELNAACWKNCAPGERAIDARLPGLRSRVAPLGITIRTIRSRGFLLEVTDP